MPKKKLSPNQIEKLIADIKSGATSASVAKDMGVSVATVNNYRAKLKKQGHDLPAKRGRKSSKAVAAPSRKSTSSGSALMNGGGLINFFVNGVRVQVDGSARNVLIERNTLYVEF